MILPFALLSAAAASIAYYFMKPKKEEFDYDSDDSDMSEDFSKPALRIFIENRVLLAIALMLSEISENLVNRGDFAESCNIGRNSTFAKPMNDSGFNTSSTFPNSKQSMGASSQMNSTIHNQSTRLMDESMRGACPLQRPQAPQQPNSLSQSLPHSSTCPVYQNQRQQQSMLAPSCPLQGQQGQQMQPFGRGPQNPNQAAACPLAAGRPNAVQNACPINSGGMDPMVSYRRECIMAICAIRNNLYDGTQKVMQCIQILNGLDHFVRTMN